MLVPWMTLLPSVRYILRCPNFIRKAHRAQSGLPTRSWRTSRRKRCSGSLHVSPSSGTVQHSTRLESGKFSTGNRENQPPQYFLTDQFLYFLVWQSFWCGKSSTGLFGSSRLTNGIRRVKWLEGVPFGAGLHDGLSLHPRAQQKI